MLVKEIYSDTHKSISQEANIQLDRLKAVHDIYIICRNSICNTILSNVSNVEKIFESSKKDDLKVWTLVD